MRLPIHTSQGQVSTSGRAQLTPVEAKPLSQNARGQSQMARAAADSAGVVTLLDYGAGNVRSVRNAVRQLGYTLREASLSYTTSNDDGSFEGSNREG